jgi:hypothetical protein
MPAGPFLSFAVNSFTIRTSMVGTTIAWVIDSCSTRSSQPAAVNRSR